MSDESTSGDTSAEVDLTDPSATDEGADARYRERAFAALPHHFIDVRAGDVLRWLGEIASLRARLPSPESVTRARQVAAEIVEAHVAGDRGPWSLARSERDVANMAAAHIRDRARTHSGTHDEGGDVDAATLRECAEDVDGCTTLGELEALVARWREVA